MCGTDVSRRPEGAACGPPTWGGSCPAWLEGLALCFGLLLATCRILVSQEMPGRGQALTAHLGSPQQHGPA